MQFRNNRFYNVERDSLYEAIEERAADYFL